MATVLLPRSVPGLRAVKRERAEAFRAAGHHTTAPDPLAHLPADAVPSGRTGTHAQLHLVYPDPRNGEAVGHRRETAAACGPLAAPQPYPSVGNLLTGATPTDHDPEEAAALCRARSFALLASLHSPH